ncbi:MAG: phosphatase PAP2 family protein [Oscillospiraceae bacterium]|nr:phosphatase PAP2 family protein [Oscillospiraceae bacterium]
MKIKKKYRKFVDAAVLLVAALLFTLLVKVVDVQAIGPQETSVGFAKINKAFADAVGTNMLLYKLTQLLGYAALAVVAFFGFGGMMQLVKRKSLMKVDRELLGAGVLYVVVLALYVTFEKIIVNYRPVIMPGETAPEASFPSSHTLLACVVFGSAVILADTYVRKHKARKRVRAIFVILIIVMVVGRLFSGVHWITDIVAGLLFSGSLLSAFKGYIDLPQPQRRN